MAAQGWQSLFFVGVVLVALAGFCILGLHFAQVACVGSVYPTSVRAFGVGWFMLFARVGGALGPAIVGVLVGQHMSKKGRRGAEFRRTTAHVNDQRVGR